MIAMAMAGTQLASLIWVVAALCALVRADDIDEHSRRRRSNIPCGNSFTPCNRRPSGFTEPAGFSNSALESQDPAQTVTAPNIRQQMLVLAAQEAKDEVDRIFNETEPSILQSSNFADQAKETARFWMAHTRSNKYAKDLSYSALVSVGTTQRLKSLGLQQAEIVYGLPKASVSGTALEKVCPPNLIEECVAGKYRTYSGHCNNVNNPLWGAVYEPMQRLLAPNYADDVSLPRVASDGKALPNARRVSSSLFTEPNTKHRVCTMMLAHWAQFIYTDMVHLGSVNGFFGEEMAAFPCCDSNVKHPECFPIPVAVDDAQYSGFVTCLAYSRTTVSPREKCSLGPREQADMATSYLDGSAIYGSTTERAKELRSFRDGKLAVSALSFLKDLPPAAEFDQSTCGSSRTQPCFQGATEHINFLPSLTALHTIWLRQHNNLATEFLRINPHWDDERVYQETRRVVVAQVQHITYSEFLPLIIGKDNVQSYGLSLHNNGYDSDYDLTVDASVLNSYAASVGMFFYSLFGNRLTQFTKDGTRTLERPLSDYFYDPSTLYFQGRVDGVIRYLLREPIQKPGLHMTSEFRDKLFKGHGNFGLDMAALIIQIGRDHGIPSYTAWRAQCGLKRPVSFEALRDDLIEPDYVDQIARLYSTVDDVDLFVLGLAEKPLKGALVGPTFACILSKQFQKSRRGDRFWYENFFFPSAFTEDQLNEIRKTTMARVVCDNSDDIGKIQPEVFMQGDNFGNCPIECNTTVIDRMDLSYWLDSEPKLQLPITREVLDKAVELGRRNARDIKDQESRKGRLQASGSNTPSAQFTHSTLMRPTQESLDIARSAQVLLETTKILVRGEGLEDSEKLPKELDMATLQRLLPEVDVSRLMGNLSALANNNEECVPKDLPCDHTTPYRTYSGWCNNLRFPSYGNAFTPLRRLLDPVYDDGFDEPRKHSVVGDLSLPSARSVSNAIHLDGEATHVKYTHMVMQFGQFLDHDMTLAPISRAHDNKLLNCSRCDSRETVSLNCYPIPVPADDPFFPATHNNGEPRCIPFTRSLIGQLTLGYRNQLNQLTAFVDGSQIYGSTECDANILRLFSMGRLNYTDLGQSNHEALPQGDQEKDCRSAPKFSCFRAGDGRSNEHPSLAVMHTIFLREHNRVATRLHRINNFWPDEKIYQEARRIVIAQYQHIVYNEFLPKILGCETAARYDLVPKKTGYYKGYDDRCDAGISHAFSTAAFRFGHTLIRPLFPRLDDFYNNFTTPLELSDVFNNPSSVYNTTTGGMDTLLMGLLGAPTMDFDRHISDAVRNRLFMHTGQKHSGMDLPAINMQRARDHGVPGYNSYRSLCGLKKAKTWDDLSDVMTPELIASFKSVYKHVDDIDLFPALMSETKMAGALVGPTTACIIAEQFQRTKRCDRFFYENDNAETRFTPDQLAEIRKASLAKIICGNNQFVRMLQPFVFDMPDDLVNAQVACQDLPEVDLYEWLDRQFCVVDHRVINLGKTKRITPCVTCTCTAEGPECHSITVQSCDQLVAEYLFTEILEDTVCVIQCSGLIRERAGRL